MGLVVFRMTNAITVAARAIVGIGGGIGAPIHWTPFFFFTDMKNCRELDQHNNRKNIKILHSDHNFFSVYFFAGVLSALAYR